MAKKKSRSPKTKLTTKSANVKKTKLARLAHGGPPAHNESVLRAQEAQRIADRRKRVWQMYLDGRTQRDIAQIENVSVWTINMDLKINVEELRQQDIDRQRLYRARQSALIDKLIRTNLRFVDSTDLNERRSAHETLLNALSREAKLWDLDMRHASGESAERIIAMLHGLTQLFMDLVPDPILQQRWVEGIRARVKPALAQQVSADVIEVEPNSETVN